MDFLLLLPHAQRVVLEVDGSHHYATPDGKRPDATRYAANMRADRELKLNGYEVFRFGAAELRDPASAHHLLQTFFTDLFRRFGVTPMQTEGPRSRTPMDETCPDPRRGRGT
jgi:hypothetical protein